MENHKNTMMNMFESPKLSAYSSKIGTDWISLTARFCFVLAGLLAPWIAIAALPPFRFGIWIDVESTLVVFHWIAGLFALGFLVDHAKPDASPLVISPIIAALASLVILSILLLPFSLDTSLSWYGLPDSGQGILSFVGYIFMILGFKRLLDEGYFRFLWMNVNGATLVIGGITLLGNMGDTNAPMAQWSPYVYSAFLSFMAMGGLALSLTTENKTYRHIGICFSMAVIGISFNKTALISLLILVGILESKTLDTFLKRKASSRYSAIIALTPLLALSTMALLSSPTVLPTLWSRVRIIQMVFLEFLEHPWRLLVGYGWGSYANTFLANFTRVPEAIYQNGQWNPTWDAFIHLNSHSHHQVVEALLSTGIMGALIVLLLPALAVFIADRQKLMAAFIVFFLYVSASSGWFEIPATLPFIALIFATTWPREKKWNWQISSPLFRIISALSVMICFSGGMHLYSTGMAYPGSNNLIRNVFGNPHSLSSQEAEVASGPGNTHLAHHLQSLIDETRAFHNTRESVINEIVELLHAAKTVTNPTLNLQISLLNLTKLAAQEETIRWVKPLREELLPEWKGLLENVLKKAPYRTDLLNAYFRWQLKNGKDLEVWKWCQKIIQRNPKDPVALWYKGKIILNTGKHTNLANHLLKESLNSGMSRFLPVPLKLEQAIRRSQ